jgi:DNA polymerase-3 subunit alpha
VAINDVGRVLKIPYNIVSKISKKFIFETFEECIENNPKLYEEFVDYKELFDIASKISGRVRQASIHAGGVGIVDTKITDYMAMKIGSKGEHVIQVNKKVIEDIGIIKFDLLGLATTLNTIKDACKYANIDKWEIDINNPEFLHCEDTYKLLCSAKVDGVFQVESQGMKDLLLRLQPSNLEDVSAVLALCRPDSMGALDEYIECKHGRQEVKYIHPDMKPILESTYGCMIYQEQLMDIVRKFGGRTYGGADKFRKAIGKLFAV